MTPRHINAITKKHAPVFSTINCAKCDDRVDTSTTLKDASGKYWCDVHSDRGKLLNWANEHKYPAIAFPGKTVKHYPVQGLPDHVAPMKYRIGLEGSEENKDLWEMNAVQANDDVINAAMKYAGIVARDMKQEQEELG